MFHLETLDSVQFPAQRSRLGLPLGSFWKWSITNFSERKVEHQLIILINFLRKLHNNENKLDKRVRVALVLHSPWIRQCFRVRNMLIYHGNLPKVPNRFYFLRSLPKITSACIAILLEDGYSLISHRADCIRSDTRSSKYLQYPYRDVTTSCWLWSFIGRNRSTAPRLARREKRLQTNNQVCSIDEQVIQTIRNFSVISILEMSEKSQQIYFRALNNTLPCSFVNISIRWKKHWRWKNWGMVVTFKAFKQHTW